jgi:hypothetical protein
MRTIKEKVMKVRMITRLITAAVRGAREAWKSGGTGPGPMKRTNNPFAIGSLIAAAILLWPCEARAGQNAANAFDMGLNLGFASYQASVNERQFAKIAINDAQVAADRLADRGFLDKTNILQKVQAFSNMHDRLVTLRSQYEDAIRQRSNKYANAYRLGLLIGLAEAQCTSPVFGKQDGAWKYAHHALNLARELIRTSGLSKLKFNPQLLQEARNFTNSFQRNREDAYRRVADLRWAYRDVVLVSNY